MATTSATVRRLLKEPINPRTGAAWRLTDPEVSVRIDSLQETLRDPTKAMDYLKKNGFVTPTGRTPKKYGG